MRFDLPPPLERELAGYRRTLGDDAAKRHLADAAAVAHLLAWCRQALAASHLVTVAYALNRVLGADLEDLRTLRLPADLLAWFPAWRRGSREGFRPRITGWRLAPAGAALPLQAARLHIAPPTGTAPLVLTLIRYLSSRLDPEVRLTLVTEPEANRRELRRWLVGVLGPRRRARLVALTSATVYARDSALAALDRAGRPALLTPRGFRPERGRAERALPPRTAARVFGMRVARSRLYWEGGNILRDAEQCIVGADTIAQNRARLGLTADEILQTFRAEMGTDVAVLGDPAAARFEPLPDRLKHSAQASYHIDLDVALLGRVTPDSEPAAILADPAAGLDLLPEALAHPTLVAGHFARPREARRLIAAEYRATARERGPKLERYRQTLRALGYHVSRVPDLRGRSANHTIGVRNLDLSYCNVVPGLRRGRPSVYYLPWGVPALDRAAEAGFRAAGVEPIGVTPDPHTAHALMHLGAGLRCLWGPLA